RRRRFPPSAMRQLPTFAWDAVSVAIRPWPCENAPLQPDREISFHARVKTQSLSSTRIPTGVRVGTMFSVLPSALSFHTAKTLSGRSRNGLCSVVEQGSNQGRTKCDFPSVSFRGEMSTYFGSFSRCSARSSVTRTHIWLLSPEKRI